LSAGSRFDRTADRYAAMAAGRDWSGLVGWCEPASGDRALDVAGGPGALAAALLPKVGAITVLDTSARLLEFVPDGIGQALGGPSDAFDDGSLDLVTLHQQLHHIARPARGSTRWRGCWPRADGSMLEDFIADDRPGRARRWEEIERLRDPSTAA
jgi:hypothetical protein